jgi:hypothetical protein
MALSPSKPVLAQEYRFIPATRVAPTVRTTVAFDETSGMFRYSYDVTNGPRAVQELHRVSISALNGSIVASTPDAWEALPLERVGRVSWYMRTTGSGRRGIPAGASESGFAIDSENLPGPSQARCTGNAPSPLFPGNVPPGRELQFARLLTSNFVAANVLAPTIPSGTSAPQLGAAALLKRITLAYQSAVSRSKHKHRLRIARMFDGVIKDLAAAEGTNERKVRAARLTRGSAGIAAIKQLAEDPGADAWASTLGQGLTLALNRVVDRLPQ